MSEAAPTPVPPSTGPAHPVRVFLTANFVYLWVVYFWALGIGPSGRDLAVFSGAERLPWLSRVVVEAMHSAFGTNATAYIVTNILVLYGCMVGVFFLTRAVLGGAWWLGSLVAVLMMASPLKGEAMLQLSGISYLLPALCAIWGLVFAVWPFGPRRAAALGAAFALVGLAGFSSPTYALLPLVVVVLQLASPEKASRSVWIERVAWVVLAVGLILVHRSALVDFSPVQAVLSLFVAAYPIGLLPGTVNLLQGHVALAALAVVAVIAVWLGLWRLAGHPAVLCCGIAALLLRVPATPMDLVDFSGGGTMLLPIALVAMGFTAICQRIMQHPAWPRHVVFLTTALCLVFFFLQIQSIDQWKRANVAEAVAWPAQSGAPQ